MRECDYKIWEQVSLIDEDYPSTFNMDEFKSLTSFKKRIAYCNDNLNRLAAGSSRIAYQIDDDKVLKLAKNKKGLAQNKTEIMLSNDVMCGDIIAKVLEYSDDHLWVEMELAKPVSKSNMETFFGVSQVELLDYLESFYYSHVVGDLSMGMFVQPDEDVVAKLNESDFIMDLKVMMKSNKINPADFCKPSSYGWVSSDGQPRIVLIDYGITDEVYDSYYSV